MFTPGQIFTRTLPETQGLLAAPMTQTLTVVDYKPTSELGGAFAKFAAKSPYVVNVDGYQSAMSEKDIQNWIDIVVEE